MLSPKDKKKGSNPRKDSADDANTRSVSNRPPVNASSRMAQTDKAKKESAIYGVGAKVMPKGTAMGDSQRAVAKQKASDYRAKTGNQTYTAKGLDKGTISFRNKDIDRLKR